jgi:hypothetical protein
MAETFYTQNITAKDISERGIIRVPQSTKSLFPRERAYVEVELRGERKTCLWDPADRPDKRRSGVIRVGKPLMRGLLPQAKPLRVTVVYHLE